MNEEKYKLLLFSIIRNQLFDIYTKSMPVEEAISAAGQVAIVTISKMPETVNLESAEIAYKEALEKVQRAYAKDGITFVDGSGPYKKPDININAPWPSSFMAQYQQEPFAAEKEKTEGAME